MVPMIFAKVIMEGTPIDVFNFGGMKRDFTYIDDFVAAMMRVINKIGSSSASFDPMNPDPATSNAQYRLFNVGNHQPGGLMVSIEALERVLGKKAITNFLPMQAGYYSTTVANTLKLQVLFDISPDKPIAKGIVRFVKSYRRYRACTVCKWLFVVNSGLSQVSRGVRIRASFVSIWNGCIL